MKIRTYLLLLATTTGLTKSIAQDFYIKAGTGYAFAMPGGKLDQNGNALNGSVIHSTSSTKYDLKSASFSSGLHGNIGGGYMFSKNIGIELNADLNLDPHTYRATINGLIGNTSTTTNTYTYNYIAERQANNMIILMPSLVLQTGGNACNLYMRMGLALPFNTGIKLHETYLYSTGDVDDYTAKIQNYFSVGIAAATGVRFKVSEHMSIWGEISTLYLSLSREQNDLETAKLNGINRPLSQLTGIKTVHYNKNGISDQYGNAQALPQPFSNIGINAGISYNLSQRTKKK